MSKIICSNCGEKIDGCFCEIEYPLISEAEYLESFLKKREDLRKLDYVDT